MNGTSLHWFCWFWFLLLFCCCLVGFVKYYSSLAIWKNKKHKGSCQEAWLVNSHVKCFMGSPELYKFIFYRDLHALCISDICFKTVQLHEWKIFTKKALKFGSINKKYFYFCKLIYCCCSY